MRSIEDIDFEIDGLNWGMRSLMLRLEQLDKERQRKLSELHKEVHGYDYKSTYCICSYQKGKIVINPKCIQHAT